MNRTGEGDFLGKGTQPDLLPAAEVLEASGEALAARKQFTAERVSDDERRFIIERVVEGVSQAKIVRMFAALGRGISRNTVAAVVAQAQADGTLPDWEARMKGKLEIITEDWVDARLENGPAGMSTVDVAILFDKRQTLANRPTAILEIRGNGTDVLAEHERRLAELKKAAFAEAITVTAEPAS